MLASDAHYVSFDYEYVITITIVILELVPFSVTGLITVRENETYVFYGLVFNFYWM